MARLRAIMEADAQDPQRGGGASGAGAGAAATGSQHSQPRGGSQKKPVPVTGSHRIADCLVDVTAVAWQAMDKIYKATIDEQNSSKIKTISVERFLDASRDVRIDTGFAEIKGGRPVPDLVETLQKRMGLKADDVALVRRAGERGGVLCQLWTLLCGNLSSGGKGAWTNERDNDLKFAFQMSAAIHGRHSTGDKAYWGVLFGPALFEYIACKGATHLLTMHNRGGGFTPSADALKAHIDALVQQHRTGGVVAAIDAAACRGGAITLLTDNYTWLCPCRIMTSSKGTYMLHDNTVVACKPDFDPVEVCAAFLHPSFSTHHLCTCIARAYAACAHISNCHA